MKNRIGNLARYFYSLKGWKTDKKIVVIESDDWGSIRMPSKHIYNKILKKGYKCDLDPYLRYDSLASNDDLEALFEALLSVRDSKGNPAKITANSVMTNPNFSKIENDKYVNYYHEDFTETLANYPNHDRSYKMWKEGLRLGIFKPQFHGREHVNVFNWINDLRNGDKVLLDAFSNKMISISSEKSKMTYGYMESLDFFSNKEKKTKDAINREGIDIFKSHFNYNSRSFIANCYIWHRDNENMLHDLGVKYIQGIPFQHEPFIDRKGRHSFKKILHYIGQKNKNNQIYLVRNAFFEPSLTQSNNEVSSCLNRIEKAFNVNKPAIIGSHRLNYIGFVDESNRIKNIKMFKELLNCIVKKWPSVEFMSSDELGEIIEND